MNRVHDVYRHHSGSFVVVVLNKNATIDYDDQPRYDCLVLVSDAEHINGYPVGSRQTFRLADDEWDKLT